MNKKGFSQVGLIITALAVLVAGGAVLYFAYQPQVPPGPIVGGDRDEHGCIGSAGYSWCEAKQKCLRVWEEQCGDQDQPSGWQTYSSAQYGFEIKYPKEVVVKEDSSGVSLSHGIAYKHSDVCDMRDGGTMLNEVTDFNAKFRVFSKDVESTVKATYSSPKDIIENGQFKLSPGFVDPYSSGKLIGHKFSIGAEGCGLNTYYFPLGSSSTLVVTQTYTPERTPLISDYKKYLALPGILSPEEEKTMFDQILSTFTIVKEFSGGTDEEGMEVKIYLAKSISQTEEGVFAVSRRIPKTSAVATAAINELLIGPYSTEVEAGYFSTLPLGSKLNSLKIENGVAYADFNQQTQSGGGSTSMILRRSQITQTLKQFSTIKSVVLSIDGNSQQDLIFQP